MPTYTYACKDCGHRFDQRQSFTDPALTDCPQCSGALRKVLNSVGIVFKGSGFYRTDSRTTPGGALAGKSAGAEASSSSSGSSSDKPATGSSSEAAPKQPANTPSKSPAKQPAAV
jgi:putative FmdB family regulatory protein